MTQVRVGQATDVGRRRQKNDDTALVDDRLFAVADGMGGYSGGEIASFTAIEALRAAFRRAPTADGLERGVTEANQAVAERASTDPDLSQMGTTLSAVAIVENGNDEVVVVAHVGDSRVYLLRDGELTQLTDDHTVPEEMKRAGQLTEAEAAVDPRRHMLTRVLGPRYENGPDMQTLIPYRGDRLVLCSDGLYGELTDNDIASVLRKTLDPNDAAARLVELANQAGGGDNITVVVVDVVDDDDRAAHASARLADDPPAAASRHGLMTADERNAQLRELSREDDRVAPSSWSDDDSPPAELDRARRLTARVVLFILAVLVVVGGAVGATAWYARASYFVGLDQGHVAIFKGRPGGVLIFDPTVVQTTDLTQAAVPAARASDVERGHEVASLGAARAYVENLRKDSLVVSSTTSTVPSTTPTSVAP